MEESVQSRQSMRELAAALGVSASTFSLALRNDPRIARETCVKVQAFALERGYRVDPSVNALMSHIRSPGSAQNYREILGWINPHPQSDYFTEQKPSARTMYGRRLWEGANIRGEQLGLKLDMFWLREPRMTGRRISEILVARGIRGILLPPLPKACGHLRIDWSQFSVTALSYSIAKPQFDVVVPDHHHNMMLMLRSLRRRGCRRIGMMTLPHRFGKVEDRFLSAYYPYLFSLPEKDRVPALICNDDFKTEAGKWLKKFRPDAVITSSHFRELIELKGGFGKLKFEIAQLPHGPTPDGYPGVDECPARIGAMGVDHVLGQINRNERGVPESSRTVLVKGSWME